MPPNLNIVDKFLGEYNDDNDNNNNVLIPSQYQYQQLLNNAYLVLQQQTSPASITTTASAMNYFPNVMVAETPSRPLIQNNYLLTPECILSPSIAQKIPITTPLISPTTIVSPATTATMSTATSSDLSETSSISTSATTTTITPPSPYQYPNHNCDDPSYLPKVTNPTDDEKRRRNTLASAKFRNKRRMKEQELERIAREMTEKAEFLECRVKELESEVKLLRGLIIDIDSSRLNGSSHNNRPINIGTWNLKVLTTRFLGSDYLQILAIVIL
ncbi:6997_t:CDS:2 [Entrophospora sp. SA101]|nr:5487_t:CDS:2 [Entrophospora sp. SA101]CAJ0759440.1 6997_t:CDS:2 [Entrophospora sp. SA101]CAJ0828061.1 966_t:CDS:2 [Entrophospora sp. SA101]CAJ0835780.1 2249_t:CDS:2 [Entrophospora sp. SA101]CAJ0885969.1 1157_t:CDS:2 [Entrophospora sp. SA101]